MNVIATHKGSRARAAVWVVVVAVMAGAFLINGFHRSIIGSFVSVLGWFALGAAQAYRSTFDTPVTAANVGERGLVKYRAARFVALFALLAIVVGLAFRAHDL